MRLKVVTEPKIAMPKGRRQTMRSRLVNGDPVTALYLNSKVTQCRMQNVCKFNLTGLSV